MTRSSRLASLAAAALVTLFVPAMSSAQADVADDTVFETLNLREGQTACEVGAGGGEMSIAAARVVGPTGRVYTSELGDERVRSLQSRIATSGLSHVTVVAGHPTKTNFPDGACDVIFMRNVYHHFSDPAAMNASLAASLKPGGRLAVVDFAPRGGREGRQPADRDNDGTHGVSAESVSQELKEAGLTPMASENGGSRWFMVVVEKPAR